MKSIQHLSAIAIITIVMALIYASVQQTYRANANDPQILIAHDLRDNLSAGKQPSAFYTDSIDLEKSLATFVQTYDAHAKPLWTTGYIEGKLPQLPVSVINYVKEHGEDWITWQPRRSIRMAMGIVRTNSSPVAYIAVGRSLREVEERVSRLITIVGICWTLCIVIILGNWMFQSYHSKSRLI
ncbi:MAG: hypothetical protein ACJ748_05030 [Flavisolibacter sp.]